MNGLDTPEASLTVFPAVETLVGGKGAQVVSELAPFRTRFQLRFPPQTVEVQIEACDDDI